MSRLSGLEVSVTKTFLPFVGKQERFGLEDNGNDNNNLDNNNEQ